MSISFSSLVRLIVLLVITTTVLAVGVSRLDPPRAARRLTRPVTYLNVHEFFLDAKDRMPRWLDVDTGRISSFGLEGGNTVEAASCSPWVDEKGGREVVGRWTSRTQEGPASMTSDFGLARYSFPGGKMIDQVSTEIVPVGPPCWYPGNRARVLFEAGDGQLYHYAFEPDPWLVDQSGPASVGDTGPRPLAWRCAKPGLGEVYMTDLCWPDDRRMGGRVVVTLRYQEERADDKLSFSRSFLWWLKLDHSGTEVVEAGRLVDQGRSGAGSAEFDERAATVGTLPDGRLALAYLRQPAARKKGWELHLAPIRIEEDGRDLSVIASDSRVVSRSCQPARPAFSTDGRWLYAVVGPSVWEGRLGRLPTDEARLARVRP